MVQRTLGIFGGQVGSAMLFRLFAVYVACFVMAMAAVPEHTWFGATPINADGAGPAVQVPFPSHCPDDPVNPHVVHFFAESATQLLPEHF